MRHIALPVLALFVLFGSGHIITAQAGKRIAITVNKKGKFPEQQSRIADAITSQLAGRGGLVVIDSDQVEDILAKQNQQFSDRFSPESAVRIGKLVGASVFIYVQVDNFSSTSSTKRGFPVSKVVGDVALQANVRMTNVETGVILAQPTASFHDTAVLSESRPQISVIPGSAGGDVQATTNALVSRAINSVATDLAGKIETAIGTAGSSIASVPAVSTAPAAQPALVAGITNGAVYINKGSESQVKTGDRYNIIRTVDLPLTDPGTGKHLTSKKTICTLIIKTVDDGNSSGSCEGGLPQSGDAAQPIPR